MRPMYETPAHRSAEGAVAASLAGRWRAELMPTPRAYPVDYVAYRGGRAAAFVEVKVRRNPRRAYPTYMISAHKLASAVSLRQATTLPVLLVVRWADATGWVELQPTPWIEPGGRADRGDRQDREPCAHIRSTTSSC